MTDNDAIFKIFAASVPVLMAALGYQFQVIRAMQKQVDACIEHLKETQEKR